MVELCPKVCNDVWLCPSWVEVFCVFLAVEVCVVGPFVAESAAVGMNHSGWVGSGHGVFDRNGGGGGTCGDCAGGASPA